jgi:hypothetical protein
MLVFSKGGKRMIVECSSVELHQALLKMKDEMDGTSLRFNPYIEETLDGVEGWSTAMWVRLGMIIQEGK